VVGSKPLGSNWLHEGSFRFRGKDQFDGFSFQPLKAASRDCQAV
jgi:hypothetical protein